MLRSSSPADLSLASTVFGLNRPTYPPSSSLRPPSNLFSRWNLGNPPLSSPRPLGPANTSFELNFLRFNHELPDLSNYSTHRGGDCRSPPVQHASVGTCLFLRLRFNHNNLALDKLGPLFFSQLAQEKPRTPGVFQKRKTSVATEPSSRTCRSFSREWGKTQDAVKPPCHEQEPELGQSGYACPGSREQTATSMISWGDPSWRSRWNSARPTSAGWWPPRPGWVSLCLKGSPSSSTRSLQSPKASEEPLWRQRFSLKPLSVATRQPFNHSGTLFHALNQMEIIKLFAGGERKGMFETQTL